MGLRLKFNLVLLAVFGLGLRFLCATYMSWLAQRHARAQATSPTGSAAPVGLVHSPA